MKKNLFLAALAFVALASCTSDEFVGGNTSPTTSNTTDGAISFNSGTPAITRATGGDAATLLNNNFVVFGYKTVSDASSTVFDNYQVKWVATTGGSTESNSAGWEYVSYKNLPYGTTTASGETLNDKGVNYNATTSTTNVEQSIKYWDYSASAYDFFAYSLGTGEVDSDDEGDENQFAKASALSNSTYTLTGTQAQLGTCYISKKNHIAPPATSETQVTLQFLNFLSKIQLKFYETIPGYSVKDLKFYIDGSTKSTGATTNDGLKPAIYGAANSIPTGGTYTITFDSNYDPVVTLTDATSSDSKVEFDPVTPATTGESATAAVWLSDYASPEYKEVSGSYLGRASNAATSTKQITVLPNSTGAALTLKMDYTLVSRDGSGENINVTGAIATIPAAYTAWKPNYAYTYIFKISDNTNGSTGQSIEGLYPITLDAEVITDVSGNQTTITTVATPSITTYQNGAIANEYSAGNIYVTVGDGSTTLTVGTNANLYTATIEDGAAQGIVVVGDDKYAAITEEMAANALTKTLTDGKYTLTDANGKKLTVTPVAASAADKLVGELTAIPSTDAPGGKVLSINCASFAAENNKTYVFEYIVYYTQDEINAATEGQPAYGKTTSDVKEKHYKVIKVGTPTPVTT